MACRQKMRLSLLTTLGLSVIHGISTRIKTLRERMRHPGIGPGSASPCAAAHSTTDTYSSKKRNARFVHPSHGFGLAMKWTNSRLLSLFIRYTPCTRGASVTKLRQAFSVLSSSWW